MTADIHHGDCLDVLRALPDGSVDAVVTDPPYGLSFMGKRWDYDVPAVEVWAECLRVLKPGGHLLAFAGTRTQHRMAVRIEDAGFEIRDMIAWVYSSGFPKSMNLDRLKGEKICGCEGSERAQAKCDVRQVRGEHVPPPEHAGEECGEVLQPFLSEQGAPIGSLQCAATSEGRCEPCLEGGRHDAQAPGELRLGEVHPCAGACAADDAQGRLHHGASLDHGVLDRSDAAAVGSSASHRPQPAEQCAGESGAVAGQPEPQAMGAWPVCGGCGLPRVPSGLGTALKPALEPITVARKPLDGTVARNVEAWGTGALNIDGCRVVAEEGDEPFKWSQPRGGIWKTDAQAQAQAQAQALGRWPANLIHDGSEDVVALFPSEAGAVAPVHRRNGDKFRNSYGAFAGNVDEAGSTFRGDKGSAARFFYCAKASRKDRNEGCDHIEAKQFSHDGRQTPIENAYQRNSSNSHPTVKPTDLMRYLCRLVTPPGGTVLDPFAGSGSTGKAAVLEGFRFIGIEREADYVEIARARIAAAAEEKAAIDGAQQGDLFEASA